MEVRRIGIEAEQREKEQMERERLEQAKHALELAAQVEMAKIDRDKERIAAEERERERVREQQRIAAEQRAKAEQERQRVVAERVAEQKEKWSLVYDKIEKDMYTDNVVALVKNGLDGGKDVEFTGNSILNKPRLSQSGMLKWKSQDGTLSIEVRLVQGQAFEIQKTGF